MGMFDIKHRCDASGSCWELRAKSSQTRYCVEVLRDGRFLAYGEGGLRDFSYTFTSAINACTEWEKEAAAQASKVEAPQVESSNFGSCSSYGVESAVLESKMAALLKSIFGEDASVEVVPGLPKNLIESHHWNDGDGNPAGGHVFGTGFSIAWQRGTTVMADGSQERNGAFVSEILAAVLNRIEYYQSTKFKCEANNEAMSHINKALDALAKRRESRKERGVEDTHSA